MLQAESVVWWGGLIVVSAILRRLSDGGVGVGEVGEVEWGKSAGSVGGIGRVGEVGRVGGVPVLRDLDRPFPAAPSMCIAQWAANQYAGRVKRRRLRWYNSDLYGHNLLKLLSSVLGNDQCISAQHSTL